MGSKGAGVRTVQWTVANVEPSEQIKDASWSTDRRWKRSGFYIANCKAFRKARNEVDLIL